MRQPTLFSVPPKKRRPPRVMMHVIDAGDPQSYDVAYPDRCLARFQCRRCDWQTNWIAIDTITEARRGVPCPACSEAAPLFIPLRGEYFDAFVAGTESTEFRPYGPRWNERTCPRFRPVLLSRGYSAAHRRLGLVVDFEISREPCTRDDWRACYGAQIVDVACIWIQTNEAER